MSMKAPRYVAAWRTVLLAATGQFLVAADILASLTGTSELSGGPRRGARFGLPQGCDDGGLSTTSCQTPL